MLHRRTSADTAPVGAEAKRVLRLSRVAGDEAPASATVVVRVTSLQIVVDEMLLDLARILHASSVTCCRAPPVGAR